ncbi:hypothetical protein Q31b_16140 [Novipirellula aureliae]|uniref:Uncharacterized protein n=1 Tax=Novipirellula aureliae TaxID=2527966 RepID=A0A5C6EA97_9BACT|nr:hypothetical protein [Novipirellula aureliae]TWU44079.1 hypothetical protein Q31b_16140 [Novipirellula aureliae]
MEFPLTTDSNSEPLHERLFPQLSLMFLIKLTAGFAVVMALLQAGFSGNVFWAQVFAVILAATIGCFTLYAGLFCVASALARLSGSIIEPFQQTDTMKASAKQTEGTE